MDEHSQQTEAPRAGLPRQTPSRFAVVFWIAFGVSTMLVVGQIAFVLSLTPVALRLAEQAGGSMPMPLELARTLGPVGLFLAFTIVDALVFAVFAWFAKRHWVGLLFVPSILYLAGAFGALWVLAVEVVIGK